ncbi:similar to Saccharomyces cerevisiae YMR215W GAS3 Low abundance, possibly inactive member of the GAS family of GPI-containing proteins [Maudiozyma saulgeensis]|uniref:1,3-beta-glucanosyltransferase n=1 Tax=Maudiozyma saulgeensis TaxID=1789683 RepID=A0A1X7RA54_9SACH|nr:similar to Saccharomyces cerevisiae YMR215W GAS3 Low abundance, possibly inactive member of the GAS family of GPI-containing proteins [Kazachstania saulgeensis]
MKLSTSVLLSLLAVSPLAQAMLPIHVKQFRFIKPSSADNDASSNEVFYVKGIDYQPGGSSGYDPDGDSDVLSDAEKCARDAYVFQQLGINTVRIYSLNPDLNHDKCMTILNNAGIYVILDVNSGNYGENLDRSNPWGTYNSQYIGRVFRFIDAFKNYPNVLGFFSGNEVINDQKDYANIDPPYIRAVQRDMKQYIAKHSNRTIPVGYSAANTVDLRLATYRYLQCNSLDGTTTNKALDESRSDFFGLNTYEWCSGTSDWESSGYDVLNSTFSDTVIPLIFSEYGCNKNLPRTFDEVTDGLYPSSGLGNLFSGGLVYEYAEEANNYGLVDMDDSDGSITYKDDFDNFKSAISKLKDSVVYESDLGDSSLYRCNSSAITSAYKDFGVSNFTIPDQPDDIATMIKYGVNGTNVGKILTNYTAPTTFDYTIKDSDNNTVDATITYDSSNLLNALKVSSTSESSATATSSSSSSSSQTSSASSSKSSSKSKGDAAHIAGPFTQSGIFAVLLSVLL